MAELFESYAADYAQLQQSIESRLALDLGDVSDETRRSTLRHAEAEAEEASELLSQMEIELQSFPQSVKERYVQELRAHQASLKKLQSELRAKQRPSGTGASGLPIDSYRDDDVEAQDAAQRQQLLSGTEMLERGSQRLADSTRLALETEDVGASILQDLRRQREQIEHSRDTVVTWAIVVVLVLLILLILYSKIF